MELYSQRDLPGSPCFPICPQTAGRRLGSPRFVLPVTGSEAVSRRIQRLHHNCLITCSSGYPRPEAPYSWVPSAHDLLCFSIASHAGFTCCPGDNTHSFKNDGRPYEFPSTGQRHSQLGGRVAERNRQVTTKAITRRGASNLARQ